MTLGFLLHIVNIILLVTALVIGAFIWICVQKYPEPRRHSETIRGLHAMAFCAMFVCMLAAIGYFKLNMKPVHAAVEQMLGLALGIIVNTIILHKEKTAKEEKKKKVDSLRPGRND